MTIVKQTAVTNKSHQKHLRGYINDDKKVLLRAEQNMGFCKDLKRWSSYMERTRKMFGHDVASRRVRDKETGELVEAKNTVMFHQILAFLPDECDVNGGKLTPDDCMEYAREYAETYYPDHEVVFALHNEYCKEDKTHRYAVHMVINRSNLKTGKRLAEGLSRKAKFERAARIRAMDEKWGLKQVAPGEENSQLHKKQPSKMEKEIEARGGNSYKLNLRELCRAAAKRATNLFEYRELLESWGVDTQFRNNKMYATDTDHARYSFSVTKLDAQLSLEGLNRSFASAQTSFTPENGKEILAEAEEKRLNEEQIQNLKTAYLAKIKETYVAYRKSARELKGTKLSEFPKMKLARPPKEIADDTEIKRAMLAYWRGADELRVQLATEVPYRRKTTHTNGATHDETRRSPDPWQREGREGGKDEYSR